MAGLTTNPNSYGGAFNYDSRTGLGYGQTGSSNNSGLGSSWNMGDALSSPKGEWDDDEYVNYKECGCSIEIDCDCIDNLEIEIELKSPTSGMQYNRDAGSGKSSRNPNSYVGLANTSAYLGASHNREGKVLREFISETLKDILLKESKPSMSVSINLRKSNVGNPYKKMSLNVTGGKRGLGVKPLGIDSDGYGQNGTENGDPYVKKGKATTDGAETVYYSDKSFNWDDNKSTGEVVFDDLSPDEEGIASFKKHGIKNKYYS